MLYAGKAVVVPGGGVCSACAGVYVRPSRVGAGAVSVRARASVCEVWVPVCPVRVTTRLSGARYRAVGP